MRLFFSLGVVFGLSVADEGLVEDFERPVLDAWERVSDDAHPPYNSVDPVPDSHAKSGKQVPARDPAKGKLKPLEDAPGSFVKVRSDA